MLKFRFKLREPSWSTITAASLIVLFVISCAGVNSPSNLPPDTSGETAIQLGEHLRLLSQERDKIAAASLAAYRNDLMSDEDGKRIADFGLAAGSTIDIALAAFDAHRFNPSNSLTLSTLDTLVKAADVSMIALRALALEAGVRWETR